MKPIGILGGLGPEASNKFCEFLIKYKKAKTDQENIPFIHNCNSKIPSRIDYISGESDISPIPEMVKSSKQMEQMGVSCIVVPCNTVHAILPEIQQEISTPIIDMIQLLIKKIKSDYPPITKIGILGTTLTVELKLYEKYLEFFGIETIKLDEYDQKTLVMDSIYGIKGGKKKIPKQFLTRAANKLIQKGAEALILGCTEIPLVLKQKDFNIKLYDPMETCAKELIKYSEKIAMESSFNNQKIEKTPVLSHSNF